jgi:hypothetical protein
MAKKPKMRLPDETDRLAWVTPDPTSDPVVPARHYLELDIETAQLHVSTVYQAEGGQSMRSWHGIERRYALPTYTDAERLTVSVNAGLFAKLFRTILAGSSVYWDGNNRVGRLTDAALQAEAELRDALGGFELDAPNGGLWEAGDWLSGIAPAEEYGITADTEDEGLEAIAEQIEHDARAEGAVVVGTLAHLQWVREQQTEDERN